MKEMAPKYQNWYGDQIALRQFTERHEIKLASVSENHFGHLCDNFAYTMNGIRDRAIKILHFKGTRKNKLGLFYDSIFS